MSTKITVEYRDNEYVLEYSRTAIKQMEQNGFVLDQISEKPMTMIPLLVQGAFIKNHRGTKRDLIDEIYDHITNKIGDNENGFINALIEMYAETINTLTDNTSVEEGNMAVWKVTKG